MLQVSMTGIGRGPNNKTLRSIYTFSKGGRVMIFIYSSMMDLYLILDGNFLFGRHVSFYISVKIRN